MGETKSLNEKECEYGYVSGMDVEMQFRNRVRDLNDPNYMDRIMVSGDISTTDFFYLRAVAFLRIATAEMVVEYMGFFRNHYGVQECCNLLLPKFSSEEADPIAYRERHKEEVAETRRKLLRLAKKYLIFSHTIIKDYNNEEYEDAVFCSNDNTLKLVHGYFGNFPYFGTENVSYDSFYVMTPIHRIMESMHATRVGLLAFMKHKERAVPSRGKKFIFGSNKETYTPTMYVSVKCGEYYYNIFIEPIHLSVDERIMTHAEQRKNMEGLIAVMGRLINHYEYMESHFLERPRKERVRFLIAVENLEGMRQIAKYMNKYCEKYSGKVFFTMDSLLLEKGSLAGSIIMAKEVQSQITGETHLGLVHPKKETLIATNNEWVFDQWEQ